jgi:hypothetical protein
MKEKPKLQSYLPAKFFLPGFFLIFLFLFLHPVSQSSAQSMADIANIKVDDLSDEQIKELVRRANEAGVSETELIQMARVRGLPVAEVDKLQKRLEDLDLETSKSSTKSSASKREPRKQAGIAEITQGLFKFPSDPNTIVGQENSLIFGMDLFYNKNRRLSFEPNLNLATPKNYVLGPGDLV